ncbi:MAG: hypothetical protein M1836_002683 [Candelina mexicana]|nr:MAG: hypothetical protein M1836_002683 [Candelina mexicana]
MDFSWGPRKFETLEVLCQCSESSVAGAKSSTIPESRFEDISRSLEHFVQKKGWTARPRIYFILQQLGEVAAMEAFIAQGLNDTSLPFKGRQDLPAILNPSKKDDFLIWQERVLSDILQLERGTHVRVSDGNKLFEVRRKRLGVGSQGSTVVDRVTSKATGKVYARKRINRKIFGHDTKTQKVYENELNALHKVADHTHLIKVRGTYTDRHYLVMLLEPVANENLKEYMNRARLHSAHERQQFRRYFGCLAHTIRFLHDPSIGIIHKDIKPENILLKDGELYLADFGTAFDWSITGQSMSQSNPTDLRTPRYQSPEAALGTSHRSSDIWSLGVVFLEMVTILRGRSLADMDDFLQRNGKGVLAIHNNIEGAMNWLGPLQEYQEGSPTDNEPLSWIKLMLNRVHTNRPTAADLFEMIADFQDGTFCGSCCLDEDSESIEVSLEESELLSNSQDLEAPAELVRGSDSSDLLTVPGGWPERENLRTSSFNAANDRHPYSGFPETHEPDSFIAEEVEEALHPSQTQSKDREESRWQSSNMSISLSAVATDVSQLKPTVTGAGARISSLVSSQSLPKVRSKRAQERDRFIKWSASLPTRSSTTPVHHRAKLDKSRRSQSARAPSVETERISRYLSSLPEETTDFEVPAVEFDISGEMIWPLKKGIRSQTMPISSSGLATIFQRSKSQEDLQSSSHQLHEEADEDQFVGIRTSQIVHYASDGNLKASIVSGETLQEAKNDLNEFAATAARLFKKRKIVTAQHSATEDRQPTEDLASTGAPAIDLSNRPPAAPERASVPDAALRSMPGFTESPAATPEKSEKPKKSLAMNKSRSKASVPSKASHLGLFLSNPQPARQQWESATVIMNRILNDKASEAPTSLMSASTRAKLSVGRPVLRWNDKSYGYLPTFVANGKVGAVREMLKAGCNPGTETKPRWAPVYNAVRGASDKHLKCLRDLVSYGADVNAVRSTNGRTFLHYASESQLWSGYSSVIYTLLVFGADPNVRDNANDLPILMLLLGNGLLPQEKRDALFLLLAPNFNTMLDVSVPGTRDNPLHLAVRRKDAYTVDAILAKIQEVQKRGSGLDLIGARNGSGFTPLLLAFVIFAFKKDSHEELRIIGLLLENGANPDDQDATLRQTPLHRVISLSKNTTALRLLCRRAASFKIPDQSGQTAIHLAREGQNQHPEDEWYKFAERVMLKKLQYHHYRPPEFTNFIFDEQNLTQSAHL